MRKKLKEDPDHSQISLEEISLEDVSELHKWFSDPDIQSQISFDQPMNSVEDVTAWAKESSKPVINGESTFFIIMADAEPKGLCGIEFTWLEGKPQTGEITIFLASKECGNGIGSEALALLLEKAFEHWGLWSVFSNIFSDNAASLKIHRKMKFKKLCTHKGAVHRQSGSGDVCYLALNRERWKSGR